MLIGNKPSGEKTLSVERVLAAVLKELQYSHAYLIVPPQYFIVLLAKTELAHRLERDLPRSKAVTARHRLVVKVVSSQQETAGREIWLLGVSYLDKTCDNVGLPTQQLWMVELIDVRLELVELAHEVADVAIHPSHLRLDLVVGEAQESDSWVCALSGGQCGSAMSIIESRTHTQGLFGGLEEEEVLNGSDLGIGPAPAPRYLVRCTLSSAGSLLEGIMRVKWGESITTENKRWLLNKIWAGL
ncbi:hypothetical protein N7513_007821 [Penicillium frequentans]|nr:hypothetical protein N7513_007821 [Penicillium glabrum]